MGNTKSGPRESGTYIREWEARDSASLKAIIQTQNTLIEKLSQDIESVENERSSQSSIILTQSAIIRQLRQVNGTQHGTRQVQQSNQETQTDQDDVYHLRQLPHRTPSLSSSVQYFHHAMDRWLSVVIQRSNQAEQSEILVYNASKQTLANHPRSIVTSSAVQLRAGEKLYYHGSNDYNVKSILEHGIDVTKSTRATDFSCGRGFYVTKNFAKAVEWSKRVAGWKGGRPAVIGFKINRSLRKEEPHLALKVDSTTNRKWWECVVSYFRHSAISLDIGNVLKGVKFIKGPVANNRYVGYNEIPRPYTFTQFCICDQEYAERFGSLQNISFVIFAVNN